MYFYRELVMLENNYKKANRYKQIGIVLILGSIIFAMLMILFGLEAPAMNTSLDTGDAFFDVINRLIRRWALVMIPVLIGIQGGSLIFSYGMKLQKRLLKSSKQNKY